MYKAPVWDEAHLRLAIDAAGVALWSWNVDTDRLTMDEIGCRMWGVRFSSGVTFEDLSAHIHPADRDRVRAMGRTGRRMDRRAIAVPVALAMGARAGTGAAEARHRRTLAVREAARMGGSPRAKQPAHRDAARRCGGGAAGTAGG